MIAYKFIELQEHTVHTVRYELRGINCDLLFHCKSLLKESDYSVVQSVLMTKFWTDFFCHLVKVMEFLSLSGRRSSSWNVPQQQWGRRKVCFCRLGNWTVIKHVPLVLFFFRLLSGFLIRVFNKVLSRWQKLWIRKREEKLAPVSRALQGHVPRKIFKI